METDGHFSVTHCISGGKKAFLCSIIQYSKKWTMWFRGAVSHRDWKCHLQGCPESKRFENHWPRWSPYGMTMTPHLMSGSGISKYGHIWAISISIYGHIWRSMPIYMSHHIWSWLSTVCCIIIIIIIIIITCHIWIYLEGIYVFLHVWNRLSSPGSPYLKITTLMLFLLALLLVIEEIVQNQQPFCYANWKVRNPRVRGVQTQESVPVLWL